MLRRRFFLPTSIWLLLIVLAIFSLRFLSKPQPTQALSVSTAHPRIWLTPARVTTLKDYSKRNSGKGTLLWQKLKVQADNAKTDITAGKNLGDSTNLPPLCLVYQVTGDTSYSDAAIKVLTADATPEQTLTHDSYYDYRSVMPNMTAGYDWCYDRLSDALRKQVATWLMDRDDGVWPETNPDRAHGWGVNDPGNNYYWGFLTTWPAALAVLGDGNDTGKGLVSGSNRPQYHLDLALNKFNNMVKPWANTEGRGGMFAEGTGYDSAWRLGQILDAHLTATGENLFTTSDFPFAKETLTWRIYSTAPNKKQFYIYGDQARVSDGPLFDYDRMRAIFTYNNVNDATLKGEIQYWLQNISPSISDHYYTTPWEFAKYDEDITAIDYTKTLPTTFLAPGTGFFTKRSDWSEAATYWGIWSGPFNQSHQFADANGFLIWKNGWLAGSATIWSHSGIINRTLGQNNLTFGGLEQKSQTPDKTWPEEAGKIVKQENKNDYTYFAGQAAAAYTQDRSHGGVKILNDYTRKFVQTGDSTYFVYDRVDLADVPAYISTTLTDPSKSKEWHIQSQKQATIAGRTWSVDNGSYKLWGENLLPASGVTVTSETFNDSPDSSVSSYRTNVVVNDTLSKDTLLNVLNLTPLAQSAAPPSRTIIPSTGNMEGAQSNNWLVLFGKSESVAGPIQYNMSSAAKSEHLLLDLEKLNTVYTVTLKDTTSSTTTTQTATSSDKGSLRFSAPAGSFIVTVTASGETVPTATAASPTTVKLTTSSDVAMVKTGDTITYTISYENTGSATATAVKVTDHIVPGLAYTTGTASPATGFNFDSATKTLTWDIGSSTARQKGNVSFKVKVGG